MLKVRLYEDPIFKRDVLILAGDKVEANTWLKEHLFSKKMKKPITKNLIGECSGCHMVLTGTNEKGDEVRKWHILYLMDEKNENTLVHEVDHLALHILTEAGVKINQKNTEVFAYYHTYLVDKVKEELKSILPTEANKPAKRVIGTVLLLVFYVLTLVFSDKFWQDIVLIILWFPVFHFYQLNTERKVVHI